ncbi:unnamed protein product [Arabidopsis thaliana]|uniref:Uncharacterized protein n=1 Tax=Arabidopsis thaliana TaxID=3702 RepID=A0A654G5B0_ARATH|nr:unnamed protein product [Arabidopsis thaliana]
MESEGASTVCPLDPSSLLFLSGDGFEPAGVFFPHAAFYFPPKDKKEAYDFMDKVIDKHHRMCDERQRLGLKRHTLEAHIARVERKELRLCRKDPDYALDVPLRLRSSFGACEYSGRDMDFNLRCSESMPDFSRVGITDGDVPNVPGRRPSPPRGFFRFQIQAPCAMIKDLYERDQEIAMVFIKRLAVQHQKLTLERRKLRKKIHRMQRTVTKISRDLHTLASHSGDWIVLGISEFGCILNCILPILDLAGQGVQVFSSSRRISISEVCV